MLFKDKNLHTKIDGLIANMQGLSNMIEKLYEENTFHRRDIMNHMESIEEKIALKNTCEVPKQNHKKKK